MRGIFITFEGGEGAGKTTVLHELKNYLEQKGYKTATTREPGGIEIAEKIRHVILDTSHTNMDSRTEALLYAAARRQHLVEKVIPLLEEGHIVLCDRFIDSSLAYQGYARELGIEEVYSINKFAITDFMPDLTLLFNVQPEVGMERINKNKEREQNRLDLEKMSFHQKVYDGYQILLKRFSDRIKEIDAGQTPDQVLKQCIEVVDTYLES